MGIRKVLLATSVAVAALAALPAQALTFTLNDTGGAAEGTEARRGFDIATAYWSSILHDNVNVTLDIGFQSLGSNILGSTGSSRGVALTSDIYSALAADKTSALDDTAVANLKALTTVTSGATAGYDQLAMTVNRGVPGNSGAYSDKNTRLDNDGSINNIALAVNTATMKALGFTGSIDDFDGYTTPFDTPDGSITFSSDFAFDFDPTDGITDGYSDFIGVAIHEIGHALGFVSGVDEYDYFTYNVVAGNATKKGILDGYAVGSTLDLFRYSGTGNLDWSTSGTNKYFSIDGGATIFNGNASFATGVYNGDGDQASHWKAPTVSPFCTGLVGIMNPYLCDGTGGIITANDLGAIDAMGWDVNLDVLNNLGYSFSTADAYRAFEQSAGGVPEPASWLMMVGGFGLIGGTARRSRRSTAVAAR